MAQITLRKVEVRAEVYFATPLFQLMKSGGPYFHEEMWKCLEPFGIKFSDVHLNHEQPRILTSGATYILTQYSAAIKVMIDHFEIAFIEFQNLHERDVNAIASAAVDGIQSFSSESTDVTSSKVVVAAHGDISESDSISFASKFVKNSPRGFGSLSGVGVSFYFEKSDNFDSSSLLIEPSAMFDNAHYIRAIVDLPIGYPEVRNVSATIQDIIERSTRALGLEI